MLRLLPSRKRILAASRAWKFGAGMKIFRGRFRSPGNDVFVGCSPFTGDGGDGVSGGDIYYVSSCAKGIITRFVLADVAGHGNVVAATAVSLRELMRRYINTPDQSKFAKALNKKFATEGGRFATAVLISYFAPTDHAIICNAGHPRPLHFSTLDRTWRYLHASGKGVVASAKAKEIGASNLPLGVIHPTSYEQFAVKLERGDLLVLYSDAFIEARSDGGKPWGEDGLLSVMNFLCGDDPATLRVRVLAEISKRTSVAALDDDATMIVLHHNASNPPHQTLRERIVVLGKMLGMT